MSTPAIICRTCGWTRRHDATETEPDVWEFSPADGITFHTMDNPNHQVVFAEERDVPIGTPTLSRTEYVIGAAWSAGWKVGRERMRQRLLELLKMEAL